MRIEPPPKFTSSTELITFQKQTISNQDKDIDELLGVVQVLRPEAENFG